jgi:O-antigen/teichoic acid export membrane protein
MSTPLLFSITLANRASTVGSQVAIGFLLLPSEVGLWALALGWSTILCITQANDFARLALQADEKNRESVDFILRRWLLSGWLLVMACTVLFGQHLTSEAYLELVAATALSPFRIEANRLYSRLTWTGTSNLLAWANGAEGGCRALILISSAALGAGVWSFILGEAGAIAASIIIMRRGIPPVDRNALSWSWKLPDSITRKLTLTMATCLLVAAEGNLIPILLAKNLDTSAAGSYFFSNRIAGQIVIILYPIMIFEALPQLFLARNDKMKYKAAYWRWLKKILLLAGGMGLAISLIGPPMLRLLWGDVWAQASDFLLVLGITMACRVLFQFEKTRLESLGAFGIIFGLNIVSVVVIAGLIWACIAINVSAMALVVTLGIGSALLAIATHFVANVKAKSFFDQST